MRKANSWNHPCKPQRLGQKHRELVIKQVGRESAFIDRDIALGRWYLIAKPEHIENPFLVGDIPGNALDLMAFSELMFGSVEPPYYTCPFCGNGNRHTDKHLAMSPYPCYSCGRIGWVYHPELDAHQNYDFYAELLVRCRPSSANEAWDTYGIPGEVYAQESE